MKVLCVGDSLTRGRVSAGYVGPLARALPQFRFINAGVNKELSYHVLRRVDALIRHRPDRVTILVGTNDANASLDPAYARRAMKNGGLPRYPCAEWFRENLRASVLRMMSGTDARIALLSLPPIGEIPGHRSVRAAAQYSGIVREVAESTGVAYLPLNETLTAELEAYPSSPRFPYERWRYVMYRGQVQRRIFRRSLDAISASNGFRFLVDFIHLNSRGARVVTELIRGFLESTSQEPVEEVHSGRRSIGALDEGTARILRRKRTSGVH